MADETPTPAEQPQDQAAPASPEAQAPAAGAPQAQAPAPAARQGFGGGGGGYGGGHGGGRGGQGGGRGGQGGGRGGPGRGGPRRDRDRADDGSGIESSVVRIYRCSKVVKGGRTFSFGALVGVGDREGGIGIGYGKANEGPSAVEKGTKDARKQMFKINLKGGTVPHTV